VSREDKQLWIFNVWNASRLTPAETRERIAYNLRYCFGGVPLVERPSPEAALSAIAALARGERLATLADIDSSSRLLAAAPGRIVGRFE